MDNLKGDRLENVMESSEFPVKVYANASKLKFSGQLEKNFQTAYSRRYNLYIRTVMVVTLLIYIASGLVDYLLLKQQVHYVWEIRYFLGLPPLIVLTLYTFAANFWRFQQQILLAFVLIIALSLTLMEAVTPAQVSHVYFTGLMIAQLAGFNILRMQFRYVIVGVGVILMGGVASHIAFYRDFSQIITGVYFYISVPIISLVSAYYIERFVRKDFVQKQLLRREQKQLKETNAHLQHLVTSDSLTGIANRRHFDEIIEDEWRRAQRGCYPLSLLMIDIDYFKLYNDHYGHQRGDECLKHIAKILASYSKRAGDMVARYGGEEFALISAGTSYKDAVTVASKICKSVCNAKIPHDDSPVVPFVTVSIGVSTIIPLVDQQASSLIQATDKNLYQAKANGRNCVFGEKPAATRLD